MPAKQRKDKDKDFEKALEDLEELVETLEKGELSLDETLKQFERGIKLTRTCQSALKNAEQKVELLIKQAGKTDLEPFDPDS